MKQAHRNWILTLLLAILFSTGQAQETLPYIADELLDSTNHETLGLKASPAVTTVTIFSPTDETMHYANGVVMTAFKNTLFCMWQCSQTDEDAPETSVVMSKSTDEGHTWSHPVVIAAANDSCYCTSGGWISTTDTLVAFINTWPKRLQPIGGFTQYIISTNGNNWSEPKPVRMNDGQVMNGVIEQDPYAIACGRIIGAVHFQPGLHIAPVYTDSPTGLNGWKRAYFTGHDRGKQSRELEPSLYQRHDSTLVMIFRDQAGSFRKIASISSDHGETWTEPMITNIPDARVKQSAGNLPDGTAYLVGNPTGAKRRWPLVALLSKDGCCFDKAILLRAGGSNLQPQRYPGKAKTLGYSYPKSMVHHGKLYIAYATNKEDVEYTTVDLNTLESLNSSADKNLTMIPVYIK